MCVFSTRSLRPLVLALGLFASAAFAQTASISGKIETASGQAIAFTDVFILNLNRSTRADENGIYTFTKVPAGTHQLQVSTQNWGNKFHEATVTEGQELTLNFVFDITIHEDFLVTATPNRKSISDVAQAVSVLNEQDLLEKAEPTLGATLDKEPGVHSSYFGPGSGRPVIRGLGGDRIRVMEGGLDTGDASTVSADHAVSIDTLTTERIEILRGPATLRYGSNAVGGAINLIDNRIPEFLPTSPITGEVELRGNSVADERTGGVLLQGAIQKLAWHVDYAQRDTDDYEIPGHSEIEPEEDEIASGILENSSLDSKKGALGLSFITDRGFLGASFTKFDTNYGIPGHGHEHGHEEKRKAEGDEEEEEEIIRIDLDQRRFDLRGGLNLVSGPLQTLNFRYGQTDYEHVELEGSEIGTTFLNETKEARMELVQGNLGVFSSGAIGIHYKHRDFEAIGEEAFVPPNKTDQYALFLYEEVGRESWNLSAGLRFERQDTEGSFIEHHHEDEVGEEGEEHEDGEEGEEVEFISRNDDGVSFSLGAVLLKDRPYSLALSLTHTERAPTPEELFSNGPHLATQSFEVGNPNLSEETSQGANITLRKTTGHVTGELSLFSNRFDNFIYQQFTGEEEDGLPEFVFAQQDADFQGGELHMDITLWHKDPHHLHLELMTDIVRAELDNGENLPRISPQRTRADLEYQQDHFWIKSSVTRTSSQNRIAPFETETGGFTILDLSAGYRFFAGGLSHQVLLKGENLSDEEGRVHTSFLKDQILLPGRNVSLTYRLQF